MSEIPEMQSVEAASSIVHLDKVLQKTRILHDALRNDGRGKQVVDFLQRCVRGVLIEITRFEFVQVVVKYHRDRTTLTLHGSPSTCNSSPDNQQHKWMMSAGDAQTNCLLPKVRDPWDTSRPGSDIYAILCISVQFCAGDYRWVVDGRGGLGMAR